MDETPAAGLSFDCLILVMRILPFRDRVVCESVSRDWNCAARECSALYQTSVCIFSKKRDFVDKSSIQNFCEEEETSHFIDWDKDCIFASEDNVMFVSRILSKCPNLRVLHLKCYEEESLVMDGTESLQQLCPRIEHLSISDDTRGCYIYKDGLTMIANCGSLRHLQLRFPAESTLDFLLENVILYKSLVMHSDRITSLCTNLPLNDDNCSLVANACSLSQLLIQGTSTTMEGLTMICSSPTAAQALRELSIVIDWDVQLNLISENLQNLTCLRCTIANSDIRSVKCLSSLTQLKKLFLSVWSANSLDDDVTQIMSRCRGLQSLTVNGEVTDACLARVGELCPRIQRLEVALNSKATGITDRTIDEGVCRLRELRHLSLMNCDVSDTGFCRMFSSIASLCSVRVSVAKSVTVSVIPVIEEYAARHPRRRIRVILPETLLLPLGERRETGSEMRNLVIEFE